MVCLDLCVTCRSLAVSAVVVKRNTPRRLWLRQKQEALRRRQRRSRVPALEVRSISWELPAACCFHESEVFQPHRGFLASRLRRLPCPWRR
ncbi:unnamed protein product, partial [Laminaria digitata]